MARGFVVDTSSNLLQIVNDPGITLTLSSTQSLWGGGSVPATLTGTYPTAPLQQPHHYWFGNLVSSDTATQTTADGGAYYGYFGGTSLDGSGSTTTNVSALYISPSGKAGIMTGALNGSIASGILNSSGGVSLTEFNGASGINPASFAANWYDSGTGTNVTEVNRAGMAISSLHPHEDSEGYLMDANLNISSQMANRGDVVRFGFLTADPSFGIWRNESFGSFFGSDSAFLIFSNAKWGTTSATTGVTVTDTQFKIATVGNWVSGGAISGSALGVWGDWASGSVRVLSGTLTGSSNVDLANPGSGAFGAVTTGAYLDLGRFLNNISLAGTLGFPTVKGNVALSLSDGSGNLSIPSITFYSRNAGDPLALWVAQNITGTSGGTLQGQRFLLMDGATPSSSTILGSLYINNAGPNASNANVWLGSLNAVGESTAPFRGVIDGIAAGTFSGTTFTGSAAGLLHPVTYYTPTSASVYRYFNGSLDSYGLAEGVMGGLSLWGSGPKNPSHFSAAGFFTPNRTLTATDFVLNAPVVSVDVPNKTAMTADGGAYYGYLVAGINTNAQNNNIDGMVNALYIDPSGNAGVLQGKAAGRLDTGTNLWAADGGLFPVALAPSGSVTAANLNSAGGKTAVTTPYYPGATTFTGTPAPANIATDSLVRSYITGMPEWGIGEFGLYAPYANAPTSNGWTVDFNIVDSIPANVQLSGTMVGDTWDAATGKLHAVTRGAWMDMLASQPAAAPMTGIFIGETVGTFNPSTMQAITAGVWLETAKFLAMADPNNPAGIAALQKLNIPAVEVGSANFSGSKPGVFDVTVNNLKFFAPVAGGRPQVFATNDISGNFQVAAPFGSATLTQLSGGANASGFAPVFSLDRWDSTNNKWAGSIFDNGATGVVGTSTGVQFKGVAAGMHSGGTAGSFSGTAAGLVK